MISAQERMAPCLVCRSELSVINNSAGKTAVVKLDNTHGTTHYSEAFPLGLVRVSTPVSGGQSSLLGNQGIVLGHGI